MTVAHVDFETCCNLDLKKVGADVYSRDPSLIVTVLAWAIDGGPVQSVTCPNTLPTELLDHLRSGGEFRAWSAQFEWAILTNHFGLTLDPAQAVCVMQKALHSGLPASLEDAGPAIGAAQHKDASARRLMLQLSKPRKNRNKPDSFWHVDDPAKLDALEAYCRQDVEAERAIDGIIADLPPTENAIAIMDRKANNRGVRLDMNLVRALKALALDETALLNRECDGLTQGAVTSAGKTQTARLLAWLNSGLPVPYDLDVSQGKRQDERCCGNTMKAQGPSLSVCSRSGRRSPSPRSRSWTRWNAARGREIVCVGNSRTTAHSERDASLVA